MSNSNEHKSYDREVRQESYNNADGHTHTNVTRTTKTVNESGVAPNSESYKDGYVHGRVSERSYQNEGLAERDNNTAARGLLIGIILTSLMGLVAGTLFLLNQSNEDVPVTPAVVVPNAKPDTKPSPTASQAPEKQTTIIEKTREVLVPVPQQQAPAPKAPAPKAPATNTNISTPNPALQQPAARQSPATQTAPTQQPQSQSSSTPAPGTQRSTDTATPAPGTQRSTDTATPAPGTQRSTNTATPTPGTQRSTDTATPAPGTSSQTDTTSGSSSSPTDAGSTGGSTQ